MTSNYFSREIFQKTKQKKSILSGLFVSCFCYEGNKISYFFQVKSVCFVGLFTPTHSRTHTRSEERQVVYETD